MAIRTWRGRRLGTVEDAADICGVKVDTYHYYKARLGAPKFVTRDPQTGKQEYDLDEVAEWNAARPGQGARSDLAKPARSRSSRADTPPPAAP